ncbi:hypothetical protein ACLI1A_05680 [Flavobacterium sp. RHBU_3]|uniref:hypothetical protein n=1 Tax=Flavobacterium sp. RHBU_3 TaxID=3391184 RepID=UPI003984F8D7
MNSQANVSSATNATDQNLTTAARLTTQNLAISFEGSIELKYSSAASANTPTYVKINMEDSGQLQALVGGAVGSLLNSALGIVFGQQYLEVSVRNDATTVLAVSSNFDQQRLRIVRDSAGNYYIVITPNANYNIIKITNKLNGLAGSRWLDVYDAFYVSGTASCAIGNYTSYTATGLVSLGTAGVFNSWYAIDADATNYSTISLGQLGAGTSMSQIVYFEGPSSASDYYFVKFGMNSALLSLGILANTQIVAYNGATEVYNKYLNDASFASLNLSTSITNGQIISLPIQPGAAVDRIVITTYGLASLGALIQAIDLYGVVKGNYTVSISGGGSYQVSQTVTLAASVSGCNSPYTYSWSSGLGSVASVTAPSSTPGTYNYTVTVTDKYGIQKTGSASVTIEQPPVAGTVSGGGPVCYGYLSGDLTLSGYTGNIVRWDRSTSPSFATVSNIANTTATLTSAEIGTLTQTTYFRAVVKLNSYAEVYATATLTIHTTSWNGNAWVGGSPTSDSRLYINANYSEAANLNGCALEVNNGAVVSIPSEYTVTLQNELKVNSGSFTLQSNAHLVQVNNVANTGEITAIRKSSQLFRLDYTLWSSPVTGTQTLYNFSPATANGRFYEYKYDLDGTTYSDLYWPVNQNTTTFSAAKSFLIRMPNVDSTPGYNAGTTSIIFTANFIGVPNNGTITKALSIQGNRFTAIGNPYPSPINVQAFFDANGSKMETDTGLYFWRKKNNQNATSYAILTRDVFISNPATGGNAGEAQYGGAIWDSYFNNETDPADWVINPGQGFFIKTDDALSSANVTFTNSMRRGSHNAQFFKSTTDEISKYGLDLIGPSKTLRLAVVYSPTASMGIDAHRDVTRFETGEGNFFTIAEDKSLAVQARPDFTITDIVPMGYTASEAGTYTLHVAFTNGAFAEGQKIYVYDKIEGVLRNLSANDYVFTTEAGTFNDRFEVLYTENALSVSEVIPENNALIVYKSGNSIGINAGNMKLNQVEIYDVNGRKIIESPTINGSAYTIDAQGTASQVLIVKSYTDKGTISKKIVF